MLNKRRKLVEINSLMNSLSIIECLLFSFVLFFSKKKIFLAVTEEEEILCDYGVNEK